MLMNHSDIDECAVNPCGNGGSCQDKVNDYECECTEGYVGKNCTGEEKCILDIYE